ncbi:MAG: DUF3810 family protein [Oscillospiraceae bacterium]|nr:DUF3810 family protein [Oscillospiraceae bacterium]
MKRKSKYWRVIIILLICTVLMGILCFFPAACDWYTDHIYGFLCDGISHVTGLLPFALGEIMMYLGILLLLLSIPILILLIFLRKKTGYKKFCAGYFKTFLMMGVCVIFLYMPCWLVPFCGTLLGKGENDQRTDFTLQEISALYAYAVNGMNQAAEEIEIAEDGTVNFYTVDEGMQKVNTAMQNLADEFPRLAGYYPPVKTALCSDILERMGIGGYNYPFTMEPTHNKYMSPIYTLNLDAHELSHHKGYYKENEAELLSQLALTKDADPFLRFSGYDRMFSWIQDEWDEAVGSAIDEAVQSGAFTLPQMPDPNSNMTEAEYEQQVAEVFKVLSEMAQQICGTEIPELSQRVYDIWSAAAGIRKVIYEADEHPIDDMPAVQEVIEETAETGWTVQGEILQENTYSGVVLLLLQYFDGKLY